MIDDLVENVKAGFDSEFRARVGPQNVWVNTGAVGTVDPLARHIRYKSILPSRLGSITALT